MPSSATLLYRRLYVAVDDLQSAEFFARHLVKKGWHFAPWEGRRRWSTYLQQAAFTSAFVTAYARPFTSSRGWPSIPMAVLNFSAPEIALHAHLLDLRNQVYAHSDSIRYVVNPSRIAGHASAIVGAPPWRLSREELERCIKLIEKLQVSIRAALERLIKVVESEAIQPLGQRLPVRKG